MRRSRGGYTVIEVSIVLMITAVMFGAAITLFQGQQGKTVFSQSLYDLSSQIQNYASQVKSGIYPGSTSLGCKLNGLYQPYVVATPNNNGSCLFLGKAMQIVANQNQLYAYTVLGAQSTGAGLVTNFDSANPEPAVDNPASLSPVWSMYNIYTLPAGATFTQSKVADINNPLSANKYPNYNIVGLYNDLAGSSTGLILRGYPYVGVNYKNKAVLNCIAQTSCTTHVNAQSWELCVQYGTHIGHVTVNATPGGVTTSVSTAGCV